MSFEVDRESVLKLVLTLGAPAAFARVRIDARMECKKHNVFSQLWFHHDGFVLGSEIEICDGVGEEVVMPCDWLREHLEKEDDEDAHLFTPYSGLYDALCRPIAHGFWARLTDDPVRTNARIPPDGFKHAVEVMHEMFRDNEEAAKRAALMFWAPSSGTGVNVPIRASVVVDGDRELAICGIIDGASVYAFEKPLVVPFKIAKVIADDFWSCYPVVAIARDKHSELYAVNTSAVWWRDRVWWEWPDRKGE